MKRCFLAVKFNFNPQYYNQVKKIENQKDIKMSITNSENYHFTLHFFGEIDKDIEDAIVSSFSELKYQEFELTLGYPIIFPKNQPNQTRILGIEPIVGREELVALNAIIRNKIKVIGLKIENRQYSPHLTIARIKFGKDRKIIAQEWLNSKFENESIIVKNLTLFQSTLTPKGSMYSIIADFSF